MIHLNMKVMASTEFKHLEITICPETCHTQCIKYNPKYVYFFKSHFRKCLEN